MQLPRECENYVFYDNIELENRWGKDNDVQKKRKIQQNIGDL